MMAFSTRSWISSTEGLRPISSQEIRTLSEMRRICSGVMRALSSTASLALVTAITIFSISNTTSEPFLLMIFILFSSLSRIILYGGAVLIILHLVVFARGKSQNIEYFLFSTTIYCVFVIFVFPAPGAKVPHFCLFLNNGLKIEAGYSIIPAKGPTAIFRGLSPGSFKKEPFL